MKNIIFRNIDKIKNPPDEYIELMKQYFMALIEYIKTKKIVMDYEGKILKEHSFKSIFNNEIVINPDLSYHLNESDYQIFWAEVIKARKQLGIKVNDDSCPLIQADQRMIKAENDFIDAWENVTGISRNDLIILEDRNEYIRLSRKIFYPIMPDDIKNEYKKLGVEL